MQFSKEEITYIAGNDLERDAIEGNPEFEWVDFVGIPQRPVSLQENLYFTTYSKGEGGWSSPFDRREKLPVNAHFLDHDLFYERFADSTGYTIYHKALSTRKMGFDPQEYLESRI